MRFIVCSVSIPHRYAENLLLIGFNPQRPDVSIPHRYAENRGRSVPGCRPSAGFQSLIGMLKTVQEVLKQIAVLAGFNPS